MSRAHRIAGFAVAVLFAAASSAPIARADDLSQSEDYVQRGIELRRQGKNREALSAFEQAYRLESATRTGAQIALAHQALGDWVEAEVGLQRALTFGDDPWIARYRDDLERALAIVRAHLGWLIVEANVAQGELVVDETSHRELPSSEPVRVVAGSVPIEVRAPGFISVRRAVDVAPGAQVNVAVALEAIPPSSPLQSPAPPASHAAAVSPDAARGEGRSRMGAYVPMAAAVVLAGAGVVSWRVRENEVAIYNDDSRCLTGTMTRAQQCGPQAQAASVALGIEIGAFAAAGASAALGVWQLWRSSARSTTLARLPCAPWASLGMSCGGRF
jgi:hypothetical protein